MYGMGESSIAASLNCSIEEAKSIKQGFFNEFPKVEEWVSKTDADAKINGYVEDIWGRRRRLPDILKEKYEVSCSNLVSTDFNPLIGSSNKFVNPNIKLIEQYKYKLNKCKNKNY